jgi:hypothetical protein
MCHKWGLYKLEMLLDVSNNNKLTSRDLNRGQFVSPVRSAEAGGLFVSHMKPGCQLLGWPLSSPGGLSSHVCQLAAITLHSKQKEGQRGARYWCIHSSCQDGSALKSSIVPFLVLLARTT